MEFWQYCLKVNEAVNKSESDVLGKWRMGQAYFNVLDMVRPELADEIRGTDCDPFYNNELIVPFLAFVHSRW